MDLKETQKSKKNAIETQKYKSMSPNQFRDTYAQYFANLIINKLQLNNADEKIQKTAKNIEISVFNFAIQEANHKKVICKWNDPFFVHLYCDRMRTFFMNLEYLPLLTSIYNGEISMQELEKMTNQEMRPDIWDELIEKKKKKDLLKFKENEQAFTDMFHCKKCNQRKTSYYELQTRSADEPTTIFITCLNCGKKWRE